MPRLIRCLVLAIAMASVAISLPAAATPADGSALLASGDLLSDVTVLERAYHELHPGLYRYNTKAQLDQKFDALRREVSRPLSLRQAYLAFSTFAAGIKCGHTYPNFFNQSPGVSAQLFEGHDRIPFYFRWLDRKMIVTTDFTPGGLLARGTEVLTINGFPVRSILARLMTIARADGSNDAKRVASLEVSGDSLYEAFDVYFPMFFPQATTNLQLVVRSPGDAGAHPQAVEALSFEERVAPIKAREAGRRGGSDVLFDWKTLDDGSAYLRMPTWALYDSTWDWKTWLNAHLDELADNGTGALVVDLRGNEGGNDIGNEILKRIVTADTRLSAYRQLVRYRKTPADLDAYLDTWDPRFRDWQAGAVELERAWPTAPPVRYLALAADAGDPAGGDVIHPAGKHFAGKLYVLIDANNSSATFQFADAVQRHRLGTLVGQPSGGNRRGINGSAFFFLRLPHSGIEMDLPLVGFFPAFRQPDAGLVPDVAARPTVADIAANEDVVLSAARRLIREHR